MHKNHEGFPDPTAGDAIREADRPPEHVETAIRRMKVIAGWHGLEVMPVEREYCCSCKWYAKLGGVCCNGNSECCAEFRCLDDTCEKWEVVAGGQADTVPVHRRL